MEIFKQESEFYKEFFSLANQDVPEEKIFDVIAENLGMTREMEDNLRLFKDGQDIGAANVLELLLFTDKWIMKESYEELLIEFRNRLFLGEYDIDILLETIPSLLWSEILIPSVTNTKSEQLVRIGNLRLIEKAIERGCVLSDLSLWATYECNLEILRYAHSVDQEFIPRATTIVADMGCLDCLIFLHENGCPWNKQTTTEAASSGHIDCLVYAHENSCPWDEQTTEAAAMYGNVDCLRYAHENGCPWTSSVIVLSFAHCNLDCLVYVCENFLPRITEINLDSVIDQEPNSTSSDFARCFRYLKNRRIIFHTGYNTKLDSTNFESFQDLLKHVNYRGYQNDQTSDYDSDGSGDRWERIGRWQSRD